LLSEIASLIACDEFAERARHPQHPQAFTRRRDLPLPALVSMLLSQRGASQQRSLDAFFGALDQRAGFVRGVSDRAFAKARSHLHQPALGWLNDRLLQGADRMGALPRWNGFRVVAADASVLRPAVRACHRVRGGVAGSDQRLFALYLPAAELTLHASVHAAAVSERAMLMEALPMLSERDLLVLDRGYPAAWLCERLSHAGRHFVMRCDGDSGFAVVQQFMRSGEAERWVSLPAPKPREVADWGCERRKVSVRLVRHVSPTTGQIRVLMTNVTESQAPAEAFAALYHQRWRIEEAFKRLKHRMKLESVSGLSQHALIVDVAAKVLADNLAALMCLAAQDPQPAGQAVKKVNRAYAADIVGRMIAPVLLAVGDVVQQVRRMLALLAKNTQRYRPGRARPRPKWHVKPHPSMAYKG
jgi:hypothetical protein